MGPSLRCCVCSCGCRLSTSRVPAALPRSFHQGGGRHPPASRFPAVPLPLPGRMLSRHKRALVHLPSLWSVQFAPFIDRTEKPTVGGGEETLWLKCWGSLAGGGQTSGLSTVMLDKKWLPNWGEFSYRLWQPLCSREGETFCLRWPTCAPSTRETHLWLNLGQGRLRSPNQEDR